MSAYHPKLTFAFRLAWPLRPRGSPAPEYAGACIVGSVRRLALVKDYRVNKRQSDMTIVNPAHYGGYQYPTLKTNLDPSSCEEFTGVLSHHPTVRDVVNSEVVGRAVDQELQLPSFTGQPLMPPLFFRPRDTWPCRSGAIAT